jgi:hypothetical protein
MREIASILIRRYGTTDSSPNPPARSLIPHRYDIVHDSYGPGVVLGWICVAYGVAAHCLQSRDAQHSLRLLDKDLVLTLAYPIVAATHMVVQFVRYPGVKREIWTMTDDSLIKYATAISAAHTACVLALGINLVLAYVVHKSKRRVYFIMAASTWILVAVIVVSLLDAMRAFVSFVGIFGAAWAFVLTPGCIYLPLHLLAMYALHARVAVLASLQGNHKKLEKGILVTPFLFLLWAGFVTVCAVFVYMLVYAVIASMSDKSLLELGQASALGFGMVNVCFSVHGIIKEHWKGWRTWSQKLIGYELAPQLPNDQRLPK